MPLLLVTYLGFVSLGLPDAAAGVAWPSLRDEYALEQGGLGFILLATGAGYLVSALAAGRVLARFGVATVLYVSTAAVALGLAGYAAAPSFAALLACAPVVGLGSGAIDSGLNHYAARHFSPRHMNWLHACYGLGAAFGPLLLTLLLSRGGAWRDGYAALAAIQACTALVFFASRRRVARSEVGMASEPAHGIASAAEALRHPLVWLQVALFAVYGGLEVTMGQWSFTAQTEGGGAGVGLAGAGTTLYWASLTAGRFALGFVTERLGPMRLLRLATGAAIVGAALFAFSPEAWKVPSLALLGFALAPVYPTLMAETPRRLGPAVAAHAVGFQVGAAMLGALVFPAAVGWLAQAFGLAVIGALALAIAVVLAVLHEGFLRVVGRGPERRASG